MDERKIEPPPHRISVTSSEQPPLDSRIVAVNGGEIRIDRPHVSLSVADGPVAASQESVPVPTASFAPGQMASPATTSVPRASAQLQRETGRIFEQIQLQLAELTEREALFEERQAAFEDRIAAFEAQQKEFQSHRASEESALEERRLKLTTGEAELANRLTETRGLLAQIESARLAVEMERSDIEFRRASVRDELLVELERDRVAVDRERDEAKQEFERARALTAALEERLREATVEAERLIQTERERLWQTLIAEWEDRRTQFQRDHDAWLAKVQAERLEIEREKAFYEAAVRNAESDFAEARAAQEEQLRLVREQQLEELRLASEQQIEELRRTRDEQIGAIQAERTALEQEVAARRAQFQAETQRHIEVLQSEREEHTAALNHERQEHTAALSHERQTQLAAIVAERALATADQEEWNKTRSLQLNEVQGERAVLENRIRFQQEHLEKLRSDLEKAQNEHRRERQIERQRLEEDGLQLIRRMRQIDLYRSSVDEREKSLEREREVLDRTRRALSSSVDQDRLALQREQSAWHAERQIQQGELLKQQELYSSHMDSLESRRIRMEKLRTELEDTHRSTLEMRLAVEEAWVELTQAAGQEAARERVEQVRSTLVGYYRQLHEGLVEQRREHLEAQTKLERLRAEFHDERQKLMEWIGSRDTELRIGEERLRLGATDAVARDSAWKQARDRWMREKAEAEQVIRKLLAELGNQQRDPMMEIPTFGELSIPASIHPLPNEILGSAD